MFCICLVNKKRFSYSSSAKIRILFHSTKLFCGNLLHIFFFNCYAKREYGGISLLFESKKLLNVLQVMAAMSGDDTVQKVGELSKKYDGIRLGFDMKK